jgi:hypothetical protein
MDDFETLTFDELRKALSSIQPTLTPNELDLAIVVLRAQVVMRRMGMMV